jgi:hypothetical protein
MDSDLRPASTMVDAQSAVSWAAGAVAAAAWAEAFFFGCLASPSLSLFFSRSSRIDETASCVQRRSLSLQQANVEIGR